MRKLIRIIEGIPLVGGLINCSLKDFWEALVELCSMLIWSLSPIWAWTFYMLISEQSKDKKILDILIDAVSNGELFLYCTSLLAPIFYIALSERDGPRTFPSKLSHIALVVIIMGLSVLFFVLNRMGTILNAQNVFSFSLVFYSTAVVLIYIATVYKNFCLSPTDEFRRAEQAFSDQYNDHRR